MVPKRLLVEECNARQFTATCESYAMLFYVNPFVSYYTGVYAWES